MKTGRLFWGIGFILAAVLIVLDSIGIMDNLTSAIGGISIVSLVVGLFFTIFALTRLLRGRIAEAVFPVAFAFMAFEKNIAHLLKLEGENIVNNWVVILSALLLTIGFIIILPKAGSFYVVRANKKSISSVKGKRSENSLGATTVYVDCEDMTPSHFENSLGSCSIYFSNTDKYTDGGTISIENNLGSVVVNVPAHFYANVDDENNIGSVSVQKKEHSGEKTINIKVENNLGSISVKYV
jgi:predicted membrane protein